MAEAYLIDPEGWVELHLSPEEVATLLVVLCKVGGHPLNSPRAGERGITEALGKIGLHFYSGLADKYHDLLGVDYDGIVFKNFPEPEPEFEPGFFQDRNNSQWVEYMYEEPTGDRWFRVNVTPAE